MRKVLATLVLATALLSATPAQASPYSYRALVLAGTHRYWPCVVMRSNHAGLIEYRDLVSDTYDEGRKRSVSAQIKYVKQGCRNGA
jgi:hypothetical protein